MRVLMYSQMGRGEGGAESVFERVADGLEERGHTVFRVFSDDGEVFSSQSVQGRCLSLFVPPTWKGFLRPSFAYRFLVSLARLYKTLFTIRPDVVNCHYLAPDALHFLILKKVFGYRLVVSCHGSDVLTTQGLRPRLFPLLLGRADAVTCVSDYLARTLKQKYPGSYCPKSIQNGIDLNFWGKGRGHDSVTEENQPNRIISVGALREVKGHDILIESFQHVVKQKPTAELCIIGDGPKRADYERLIEGLGIESHVEITGWLPSEKVREHLRNVSIFVFPSRHEGFGIALVEAMAMGLPVIATDVGGIPEVVGTGYEFLVPPENPSRLAESICVLLQDATRRTAAAEKCRKRAKGFGWDRAINKYESVLDRAELS